MKKFEKTIHYLTFPFEYNDKLILKSGDYRIYKDATILTPGEWADSITNATVLWSEDKLREFSGNWISNYINLGHSHHPIDFVGTVQKQQWYNGAIMGDLHINPRLSRGGDAIIGIDSGMLNYLSVEVGTEDYWDSNKMMRCADNIVFLGVSILGPFPGPACVDATIK